MVLHTAEGNIAFVGETSDGRMIERYEFRQFPLTLRAVFREGPHPHENAGTCRQDRLSAGDRSWGGIRPH